MATPSSFGGGTSNPAAYLAQLGRRAKQGPANFSGTGMGEQVAQPAPPSRPVTNPFQTQQQAPIKPPSAQRFGTGAGTPFKAPGIVTDTINRGANFINENNGGLPDVPRTTGDPVQDLGTVKDEGLAMRDALMGTVKDPIGAARDAGVPVPDPSDPLGLGAMFGEGGPLGMFQQLLEMLFGKGAFGGGGGGGGGRDMPNSDNIAPVGPIRFGEATGGGHGDGGGPSTTAGGHGPDDVLAPGGIPGFGAGNFAGDPTGRFRQFRPYGQQGGLGGGQGQQMPGLATGQRLLRR